MKKIVKLLLAAVVLLLVVVVVGSLVLKFYFSDERLRSLILPPVREALGREVDFKACSIDLIRGVSLSGLVVKEADGKKDFLTVESLNLGYSFGALLQKRLEISKLSIDRIMVNVYRDRQGKFNYQSLKFLASPPAAADRRKAVPAVAFAGVGTSPGPDSALPLAIVLQRCEISGVHLLFHDALKELPDLDLKADFGGRFDFSQGFAPRDINGSGRLDFTLDARYRGLAPQAGGRVDFNSQKVEYRVETRIKDQVCTLSGSLSNYLSALPELVLNLDSPRLDLAYLAGLAEQLEGPQTAAAKAPAAEKSRPQKKAAAPPLTARGRVRIGEALYQEWRVEKFALDYDYRDQRLKISDLKGEIAGGSFAGDTELKSFPAQLDFSGDFSFADIGAAALLKMAAPKTPRQLDGRLQGKFRFSGRGKQPETLKKSLTVVGDYALEQVELKSTPLARELAATLGLPELNNLEIDRLDGNLKLIEGLVHLNNHWSGRLLKGKATGTVGLDGRLDLPISLVFNRDLSQRLVSKYAWLEGALNEQGEATMSLYLNGSLDHPDVRLDRGKLQQQLGRTLQKKVEKQLLKRLSKGAAKGDGKTGGTTKDEGSQPKDLLRQLLK